MKNVTITMEEETVQLAKVAAAKGGRSLSRFVEQAVRRELGLPAMTRQEAAKRFLDGPPLRLLNDDLTAPNTEQLYE